MKTNTQMEPMTTQNGQQVGDEAQVVTSIASIPGTKLTLAAVQEKLAGKSGKRFWKNLEELSSTQEFNDMLGEEFPRQAGEWTDAVSRRGFLKVMGASFALAGSRRLHQAAGRADLPVHQAAGRPGAGQAHVFRDGAPLPDGRDSGAGKVGRVSADQAGGQS